MKTNHTHIYCTKGKHYVEKDGFSRKIDRPKDTQSWCDECRKEYDRERYKKRISEPTIKAY